MHTVQQVLVLSYVTVTVATFILCQQLNAQCEPLFLVSDPGMIHNNFKVKTRRIFAIFSTLRHALAPR